MADDLPNIVLIVADAARAKNFSTYGYDRTTSPNLSRIASEATLYENAISPAPWTAASHASLFTGLYPSHHGTTRSSVSFPHRLTPLPALLKEVGYETYNISSNKIMATDEVLNESFDETFITSRLFPNTTDYSDIKRYYRRGEYWNLVREVVSRFGDDLGLHDMANLGYTFRNKVDPRKEEGGEKGSLNNVRLFDDVLSTDDGGPFFTYINFMETHLEYAPPDEYLEEVWPDEEPSEVRSVNQDSRLYNYTDSVEMSDDDFHRLRVLYDGAIRYTDHLIGRIYDALSDAGVLDETLFVVVGDHGENLGEEGLMGHSLSLNNELLHVPLLVSYPRQEAGTQVPQLVQTHDLFSSIVSLCDIESRIEGEALGNDTVPLPRREGEAGREYAIAEYLGSPFDGIQHVMEQYPEKSFEEFDFEIKTIYDDEGQKYTLYSTGEERFERVTGTEVVDIERSKMDVRSMRDELFEAVEEFGQVYTREETEQVQETLRDLGYI